MLHQTPLSYAGAVCLVREPAKSAAQPVTKPQKPIAKRKKVKSKDPLIVPIAWRSQSADATSKIPPIKSVETKQLAKQPARDETKKKRPRPLKLKILRNRRLRNNRSQSLPPTQRELQTLHEEMELELANLDLEQRHNPQIGRVHLQPKSAPLEKMLRPILTELVEIHNAAYKKMVANQIPGKKKPTFQRRVVCGFHEVAKYLASGQLKLIIVARDLEDHAGLYEPVASRADIEPLLHRHNLLPPKEHDVQVQLQRLNRFGLPRTEEDAVEVERFIDPTIEASLALRKSRSEGLDAYVKVIAAVANKRKCPIFFGMTRRDLKQVCKKPNFVGMVGLLNWQGMDQQFGEFLDQLSDKKPKPFFELFKNRTDDISDATQAVASVSGCMEDEEEPPREDDLTNLDKFFNSK